MAIVDKDFGRAGAMWLRSAIFLTAMSVSPAVTFAAQYTFAVEPAYPAEQTQAIYKPLLSYLSKATGEQFTLVTSKNYHFYWRDIRAGSSSDFAYDEAHLADYRISHSQYVPLVQATERWVSMNLWSFTPTIFEACRRVRPSDRGELELQDAVMLAMHELGVEFRAVRAHAGVLDLSKRADVASIADFLRGVTVTP